jgi:FHA domain
MGDPIAVVLQAVFLLILFLFIAWVVVSSRRDLAGGVNTDLPMAGGTPGEPVRERDRGGWDLRQGIRPRLVVVAAMNFQPGTEFEIGDSATMGRAPSADVPIEDPFASSAHARIFPRGQFMYIEDMGSTNGTYLNGRQLRRPEQLKTADVVRIGETEYRYQE